ncbi:MAG: hypothetical protein E7661_06065 [Ruminococcaceae bacterium]|nr:hypothetical protein [Oscillospiraceae bacterium]
MAKSTLDDLYFGYLRPQGEEPLDPEAMKYAELRVSRAEEVLRNRLTEEQIKLFEKYLDQIADLHALRELSAFKKGFALGMQLTAEGMSIGKTDT